MSRYTGPKFKLSRRLGISLSGTGKELKTPFPSRSTWNGEKSVAMVCNCKKNKNFATCTV